MSVKAQALVWEMECPAKWNEVEFKPNHKYVLICYADNADHNGKNIWPAVKTIAKKTGYQERNVQNLTRALEKMGILVLDGVGPRGTNKWRIPFDEGGAKIAPVQILQGAKSDKSLGANSLGANSLGAKIAPELNEPEPKLIYISNIDSLVWDDLKEKIKPGIKHVDFETWIKPTEAITWDRDVLIVAANNQRARTWLEKNLKHKAQEELGKFVKFITFAEVEEE